MPVHTLLNGVAATTTGDWLAIPVDEVVESVHAAGDFSGTLAIDASNKPGGQGDPATNEHEEVLSISAKGLYDANRAYGQYRADYTHTSGTCYVWITTRKQ